MRRKRRKTGDVNKGEGFFEEGKDNSVAGRARRCVLYHDRPMTPTEIAIELGSTGNSVSITLMRKSDGWRKTSKGAWWPATHTPRLLSFHEAWVIDLLREEEEQEVQSLFVEAVLVDGTVRTRRIPDYPADMPPEYRGRCPDCGTDRCVCDDEEGEGT